MAELKRGCGTRKADSFYLTCRAGIEGKAPIQWALGLPIDTKECVLTLPARGMRLDVDVPSTLLLRHGPVIMGSGMSTLGRQTTDCEKFHNTILSNVGIANHVGQKNYTPRSYYDEAWGFGASFKISKQLVPQIIASCGENVYIPVIVAQKLPVWTDSNQYYAFAEKYFDFGPFLDHRTVEVETWRTEGFGLFDKETDWLGADHFQQPLLDWIDMLGWDKATAALNQEGILLCEQPFAVALCTGIRYTGIGSSKPAPEEAYLPGVEWVVQDEYAQIAKDMGITFSTMEQEENVSTKTEL